MGTHGTFADWLALPIICTSELQECLSIIIYIYSKESLPALPDVWLKPDSNGFWNVKMLYGRNLSHTLKSYGFLVPNMKPEIWSKVPAIWRFYASKHAWFWWVKEKFNLNCLIRHRLPLQYYIYLCFYTPTNWNFYGWKCSTILILLRVHLSTYTILKKIIVKLLLINSEFLSYFLRNYCALLI